MCSVTTSKSLSSDCCSNGGLKTRSLCYAVQSPSFLEYIKNDYKNSSDTKESYKKTQARALCICDWQCVASHFRSKILRRWNSLCRYFRVIAEPCRYFRVSAERCRRSFECRRRSFCWRQYSKMVDESIETGHAQFKSDQLNELH